MKSKNREKQKKLNLSRPEDDNSFEEENVTKLRRNRGARFSRKLAIFTCIAVLGIAVALNWDTLSPQSLLTDLQNFLADFGSGKFPVSYAQGNFVDAVPMGSNIGVLTDSAFIIYSSGGNQLALRQHGMSSPCVSASGSDAVIYDAGGTQIKVESRYSELYSGTASYAITTAAVNSSGYLAVVTGSNDYLSEMTVYNAKYEKIFKWYSSGARVISVSLSQSGTRAAALTVTSKDGDILSTLYVYDLSKKDPIATVDFPGEFLLSVQYNDNGTITAVGETNTYFFNSNGTQTAKYSYADKTLKSYCNAPGGAALILSRYGIGEESTLVSLGAGGKVLGTVNIAAEVKSINTDTSRIAALRSGSLIYYTSSCKALSGYHVSGEIEKLLCLKNSVYIFGSSTVYQYRAQ